MSFAIPISFVRYHNKALSVEEEKTTVLHYLHLMNKLVKAEHPAILNARKDTHSQYHILTRTGTFRDHSVEYSLARTFVTSYRA